MKHALRVSLAKKSALGERIVRLRGCATLAAGSGLAIDREKGVIRNASVISRGPAIGHGFDVDDVMVRQVADLINAAPRGIKCRMTHCDGGGFFGGGKDPIETMVGRVRGARIEDGQCRADIHLGRYADSSPSGKLKTYLMDLAEEDPEVCGLSIVFERAPYEERRDANDQTLPPAGRVAALLAVDFVGDPGANPDGLLSAGSGSAPATQPTEVVMKPELRKYLEQCGLEADATEAEAKAYMAALKGDQKAIAEKLAAKPAADPVKPSPTTDPIKPADDPAAQAIKTVQDAERLERKRVKAIKALAKEHGLDEDWTDRMIDGDRTAEDAGAMARELAAHVAKFQPVRGIAAGSGRPAAVQVLACAALMANGENMTETFLAKHYSADVMTEAHKRRRISLKGLIAATCALDGRPAPLHDDGPAEWLSAGFSTVSMPGILGDSANKSLLEGYESLPALVPLFFGKRTVTNFREYTEYRMTGDETFDLVAPGGEIQHGTLGEEHQHYKADTYGKMFTITRTMIVNDDLGAFLQIPRRFGRGAALTKEKAGAKLVMDNTGDFFVALVHKNLSTGAGSALGSAGLTAAEKLMLEQTDDAAGKNPVMIMPAILLVPPALKGTADELFKSAVMMPGITTPTAKHPNTNIYQGRFQPYCWPFLGNTTFHASASSAYWYLFADPANAAAFLVAYLNGIETPVIEEVAAAPNVLGITWRAYFDFGVSQGDYRAAVRSNGA